MTARGYWTTKEHQVHRGDPVDHPHGPNCGHQAVNHAGQHIDYLVGDHAHHAHEGHWDECNARELFAGSKSGD